MYSETFVSCFFTGSCSKIKSNFYVKRHLASSSGSTNKNKWIAIFPNRRSGSNKGEIVLISEFAIVNSRNSPFQNHWTMKKSSETRTKLMKSHRVHDFWLVVTGSTSRLFEICQLFPKLVTPKKFTKRNPLHTFERCDTFRDDQRAFH